MGMSKKIINLKFFFLVYSLMGNTMAQSQFKHSAVADSADQFFGEASLLLREKVTNALLEQWSVKEESLAKLPLDILLQVSPVSPLSLIGCPPGTYPFNANQCTSALNIYHISGKCKSGNSYYDKELRSCVVTITVDPKLSCPEGYRATLSRRKGPCQSNAPIPALPKCDKPFVLEKSRCIYNTASPPTVGCRAAETPLGNDHCIVAYQVPIEVSCMEGYFPRTAIVGPPLCVKLHEYDGYWSLYANRGVCSNENDVISVREGINKNFLVQCRREIISQPMGFQCPGDTVPYHDFIREFGMEIQFKSSLGNPKFTCVRQEVQPITLRCDDPEDAIYVVGFTDNGPPPPPTEEMVLGIETHNVSRFEFLPREAVMEGFHQGNLKAFCSRQKESRAYLTCPSNYLLRQNEYCTSRDYSNYISTCPDLFLLQNGVCVGKTLVDTDYYCSRRGGDTLLANVTIANEVPLPSEMAVLDILRENTMGNHVSLPMEIVLNIANVLGNPTLGEIADGVYKFNRENRRSVIRSYLGFVPNQKDIVPWRHLPNHQTFPDEIRKICYDANLIPATHEASPELILSLYGEAYGGQFIAKMEYHHLHSSTPFYTLVSGNQTTFF